jgi:hypothetical protein
MLAAEEAIIVTKAQRKRNEFGLGSDDGRRPEDEAWSRQDQGRPGEAIFREGLR